MSQEALSRAILAGSLVLLMTSQSHALSLLGTGTSTTDRPQSVQALDAGPPADTYLDKRTLPAVTEAMRINREHRRMFTELAGRGNRATPYTKYMRALDVRYGLLSAAGEALIHASTKEEVAEANAAAEAILAIRTDLDRAVSATQLAVIDNAGRANGYLGACDARGELVDGTDCVRAQTEIDGETKTFWVQPWDAARFGPAVASD